MSKLSPNAAEKIALATMDALEPRRMLSASLAKGTLTVTGTDGNDAISVQRDRPHGKYITVNVNGVVSGFKASAVKTLVMIGGAGNDVLAISDTNGVVAGKHIENGGDGSDTLEGDSGNDTLIGGAGDDSLDGGAGNDSLEGDSGNDTLVGDGGNDSLDGGDGVDNEVGGAGTNIYKSDGQDHIDSTGGSHDKFETEHGAPNGGPGGGGDGGNDNVVMGLKSGNNVLG